MYNYNRGTHGVSLLYLNSNAFTLMCESKYSWVGTSMTFKSEEDVRLLLVESLIHYMKLVVLLATLLGLVVHYINVKIILK
mgnify:CR=1 FL=1